MAQIMRFTILGCGPSAGVPRPNGNWGACDPENPKNYRSRAALLVERINGNNKTVVVIDTGADFRNQMIAANVQNIDAVLYTHAHADHTHGIDDLRCFVQVEQHTLPVYTDKACQDHLNEHFGYCFETPKGSSYPPILKANEIQAGQNFTIDGAGGSIEFQPYFQQHGSIHSLGFRIGNVAYSTDVSHFPDDSLDKIHGVDTLILGALQYKPHPSHFSLAQALDIIQQLEVNNAILTHMHIPLDYETVLQETPSNVVPGYDGLTFTVDL